MSIPGVTFTISVMTVDTSIADLSLELELVQEMHTCAKPYPVEDSTLVYVCTKLPMHQGTCPAERKALRVLADMTGKQATSEGVAL